MSTLPPVIAIVGRPNVGKSTLFNRLTKSMQALVADEPGVTRDRQFGQGEFEENPYIVIDTGGLVASREEAIDEATYQQSLQAIEEADIVFFVVNAREGVTSHDRTLTSMLRKIEKPLYLVVNKVDGVDKNIALSDFYSLGLSNVYGITASQNEGITSLLEIVFEALPETTADVPVVQAGAPKVALVGRPNVGKSTLTNRLLGEERVIVCDFPGTTRDSIYVPLERRGKLYTLIDTAGVRRRSKISEAVESYSVVKTLQAIKEADIVLLLIDAKIGVTDQDLSLIDFAIQAGSGLIICINKWDGLSQDERKAVNDQLSYRFKFVSYAPVHIISALHGTGVGDLFKLIDKVYASAQRDISSHDLTELLNSAMEAHQPPLVQGRRIKLRYAHLGGRHPFTIVIHGNQVSNLPQSYQRYLSNYFIKALKLKGIPVSIVGKSGNNPFAGRRNTLTPRQIQKKRRLMAYVKR